MRLAGALADHRLVGLVVAEEIGAQRAGGNEAVGAGVVELHEQAGAGDAGDVAAESGADAVGHEMRHQPVDGLALGGHGAAFGGRDARRGFGERLGRGVGQPVGPKLEAADQRAMHDEVGVAADGTGEVRVTPQRQAEVAVIRHRVFGLRLGAQHHLVHQALDVGAAHGPEHAVEVGGAELVGLGQLEVERGEEIAQRHHALGRGGVVDAIEEERALKLAGLGRRHVGEDHELLDQLMGVEAPRRDDAVERAVGLEHELALGDVEGQRLAGIASLRCRSVGGPQRSQHALDQRAGGVVGMAVDRGLRLGVVQLRH